MVGIDGERRAVEYQFVLAAELVGVEHRQAGLDHLLDHDLVANIDLAAIIGRAVRHQQDLRAALCQRLADTEFAPDVLADRNAHPHAAEIHRPRHFRPGLEHALLIEFAIVRQIDLVALGDDLSTVGDNDRIVGAALALQRRADDDARPTIGGIGSELRGRLFAGSQERRLEHKIFRRITGKEKLGKKHKIGALPRGVGACLACLGEIAGDIADSRVQLCDSDAQDVCSGFRAHGWGLARRDFGCNAIHLGHYSPVYSRMSSAE